MFGWGQTHIASGLASILNATTPIWGVVVAHFFTNDERMNPRKLAGVLLGFGGVATMIGPSLLVQIGTAAWPSSPASPHRSAMRWRRYGRAGSARKGVSPLASPPASSSRRADHAAGGDGRRPAVDTRLAAAQRLGRDRRAGRALHRFRLRPLFPADRFGRRDQCAAGDLLVPPVAILLGALFLGETLAPQDFVGLA